ncbi:hypothetical protein ACFUTV_40545 [Streptomyces sp. NPDC057298]|uniref:hypothetical protein n=1 Tax=Streptomyces sp. NPDC057298 TaxID=3346091 RepID=UPI003638DC9E
MWSAEDVARASVRRQGEGLSVAQVADKVAEAQRRERETRQQLHSPRRRPWSVRRPRPCAHRHQRQRSPGHGLRLTDRLSLPRRNDLAADGSASVTNPLEAGTEAAPLPGARRRYPYGRHHGVAIRHLVVEIGRRLHILPNPG